MLRFLTGDYARATLAAGLAHYTDQRATMLERGVDLVDGLVRLFVTLYLIHFMSDVRRVHA